MDNKNKFLAIEASLAEAQGIADEHIAASLENDKVENIDDIMDMSKSKALRARSFGDVLAAIVDATGSYSGRYNNASLLGEIRARGNWARILLQQDNRGDVVDEAREFWR